MSKSPNIGLTLTPRDETSKNFQDFRTELAGDAEDSNMMILDKEVSDLKGRCDSLEATPVTWGMLMNGLKAETT